MKEPTLPFELVSQLQALGYEVKSIPTLSEAARWLREVKKVHVTTDTQVMGHYIYLVKCTITCKLVDTSFMKSTIKIGHDSALLAGITSAINHLKSNHEQ